MHIDNRTSLPPVHLSSMHPRFRLYSNYTHIPGGPPRWNGCDAGVPMQRSNRSCGNQQASVQLWLRRPGPFLATTRKGRHDGRRVPCIAWNLQGQDRRKLTSSPASEGFWWFVLFLAFLGRGSRRFFAHPELSVTPVNRPGLPVNCSRRTRLQNTVCLRPDRVRETARLVRNLGS